VKLEIEKYRSDCGDQYICLDEAENEYTIYGSDFTDNGRHGGWCVFDHHFGLSEIVFRGATFLDALNWILEPKLRDALERWTAARRKQAAYDSAPDREGEAMKTSTMLTGSEAVRAYTTAVSWEDRSPVEEAIRKVEEYLAPVSWELWTYDGMLVARSDFRRVTFSRPRLAQRPTVFLYTEGIKRVDGFDPRETGHKLKAELTLIRAYKLQPRRRPCRP
jgi:hypothetical protein